MTVPWVQLIRSFYCIAQRVITAPNNSVQTQTLLDDTIEHAIHMSDKTGDDDDDDIKV